MSDEPEAPRARVPYVDDPAPPADAIFESLRTDGVVVPNLYRVLANAPRLLEAWTGFAWTLRDAESPRALRELAITALATRRGAEYVRYHHARFARHHGVDPAVLASLGPQGVERTAEFSDDVGLMLELVDDMVTGGTASQATVDALVDRFGVAQAVEFVLTVAFYEAVCVVNRSFGVPVEPRPEHRS